MRRQGAELLSSVEPLQWRRSEGAASSSRHGGLMENREESCMTCKPYVGWYGSRMSRFMSGSAKRLG